MLATKADRFAEAVSRRGSESAFEVLARARALEAQGKRVVHMEIGEPDFDTPDHIKEAGIQAIRENHSHDTPSQCILELRDVVAAYASKFRHIEPWTAENVVLSPGAKPIIWNILSAILSRGDEFVYFDPAYPAYASCANYLGAKTVAIPLLEEKNWRMDLDELERRVSDRTKAIMINSPHNPTGGVLTKEDLERIADMAKRHDFVVISDEIYSRNFYDREFHSIASVEGMRDRTIVIDGFSKAYAMTGWRLGYAIMAPDYAKAVTLFNNNTFSCVASFVQQAGIAALTGDDEPVVRMNNIFRERRDALINGINKIDGMSCTMPEGAFYAFPNITKITSDDKALAKFLLEDAVIAGLRGSGFAGAAKVYLRFSYAASLGDMHYARDQMSARIPHFKG